MKLNYSLGRLILRNNGGGLNGQRLGSFTWIGAGSELRVKNRTLNYKFRRRDLVILEQSHSGTPPRKLKQDGKLNTKFISTCLPKFIPATSVSGIRGEKDFYWFSKIEILSFVRETPQKGKRFPTKHERRNSLK